MYKVHLFSFARLHKARLFSLIVQGKAALDLKVLSPTLARTAGSGYRVSREGGCLLELAPAVAAKSYDWGAKISFFLAVNELGTFLVSFGPGGNGDVSLFHDPNAGTPLAGTDNSVYKKLKATRMPDGNVMMNVSSGASSLSLPIASNEMAVLLEVFRYTSALPGAQLQGRRAEVGKPLSRSAIASFVHTLVAHSTQSHVLSASTSMPRSTSTVSRRRQFSQGLFNRKSEGEVISSTTFVGRQE